jgi:hypothetical protein
MTGTPSTSSSSLTASLALLCSHSRVEENAVIGFIKLVQHILHS